MNTKKIYNNLNLLGDLKSSIADKAFLSRPVSSIVSKKTQSHTPTNINDKANIGKSLKTTINEKLNFYKSSTDKKKVADVTESKHKVANNNYLSTDHNNQDNNNKIDIKISVNYPNNHTGATTNAIKSQNITPTSQHLNKTQDLSHNYNTQGNHHHNTYNNVLSSNYSTNYKSQNNNHQYTHLSHNTNTNPGSMTKIPNKESNNNQDRNEVIKNYKPGNDNEKYIRKKILTEGKDYDSRNVKNQSTEAGYIQNNLNISLLTYENKSKVENNYNNVTTMDGVYKNNYMDKPLKPSSNYIKNQALKNNNNAKMSTSFGYNPISTDNNQDKSSDSKILI